MVIKCYSLGPFHTFNFKGFSLSQEVANRQFSHLDSKEELYHSITLLMFIVPIFCSGECLHNYAFCFVVFGLNRHRSVYNSPDAILTSVFPA